MGSADDYMVSMTDTAAFDESGKRELERRVASGDERAEDARRARGMLLLAKGRK
jgi:hypothetical protein